MSSSLFPSPLGPAQPFSSSLPMQSQLLSIPTPSQPSMPSQPSTLMLSQSASAPESSHLASASSKLTLTTQIATVTNSQSTPAQSPSDSNTLIGVIVGLSSFLFVIIAVLLFRYQLRKIRSVRGENRLRGPFRVSPYRWRTIQTDTPDSPGIREQSQNLLSISADRAGTAKLSPAHSVQRSIDSPVNSSTTVQSTRRVPSVPTVVGDERAANSLRIFSQTNRVDSILGDERIGRLLPSPLDPTQEAISFGAALDRTGRLGSIPLSLNTAAGSEGRHIDSGIRLHRQTLSFNETGSENSWMSKDRLPPEYTRD